MATALLLLVRGVHGGTAGRVAFLGGLKAIFSQVLRLTSPVLEVLLNSRCCCFPKGLLGRQRCSCARRCAVVYVGLEPAAGQLRHHQPRDRFLDPHELLVVVWAPVPLVVWPLPKVRGPCSLVYLLIPSAPRSRPEPPSSGGCPARRERSHPPGTQAAPSSGCLLELMRPSSPTALCFESPGIILKEITTNYFIHKYFGMYS